MNSLLDKYINLFAECNGSSEFGLRNGIASISRVGSKSAADDIDKDVAGRDFTMTVFLERFLCTVGNVALFKENRFVALCGDEALEVGSYGTHIEIC